MVKVPEYKFLENEIDDLDTCPIEITSGEYAGIIYRYGKISLNELPSGDINVTMDIIIVKAPEDFDKKTKSFTETVGEIFVNIVENTPKENITRDAVDLEDDVHQD
jgi:hypothetical protein